MMFTQEDTNIDIDLKLNINLRPGNVKDLFEFYVPSRGIIPRLIVSHGKKKKKSSSVFYGENVSLEIFSQPAITVMMVTKRINNINLK